MSSVLARTARTAGLSLAMLLAAACARQTAGGDSLPADAVVATLERGPCFGRCPEYRVELRGDGTVNYDGRRNVSAIGARTGKVSPSQVKSLLAAFQRSDYATLDSAIVYGRPSCGQYATDLPSARSSALVNGTMKVVRRDGGCRNAPAFLKALEAQLDTVTGTPAWISGK